MSRSATPACFARSAKWNCRFPLKTTCTRPASPSTQLKKTAHSARSKAQTLSQAIRTPTEADATQGRRRHLRPYLGLAALVLLALTPGLAFGQDVSINFGDETTLTERAVQIIGLITLLSLAPSILVMVTSFTRIVVVLSLLRTAIGLQTAPPNSVMVSLALFLTIFVMQPTLQASYDQGIAPLLAGDIEIAEAFELGSAPFHQFMRANVREQDLGLFFDLTGAEPPAEPEAIPLQLLVPAFMISELRRAFEIGFLLFLPFVVIDMVVASVLMSMGMMMLPPVVISLPFKLIFFVLVDGWYLVAGSLVRSFVSS
ncbi:MAG: flagellar type III secretion system pore protein FliP [Alphaproteobacteria bacterium]|nr:flagellar type III secretion system pore protein FliP [Alphaproteobacteria bacterium]